MIDANTPLSKLIAVLLAILTLVITYEGFDRFYLQRYLQNEAEISRLEDLSASYKKRQVNLKQLDAHVRGVEHKLSTSNFFMTDPKESVAIAKLQTKLKNLIHSKKGVLLSSQIIPAPKKNDPFKPLTLRLQIRLTPQNLRALLYQLEGQKPSLFVDTLSIQPVKHPRGADQPIRQELNVELDIVGYLTGKVSNNET